MKNNHSHISRQEGLERATEVLHDCLSPFGFLASPTHKDNYRRVFSRDGVILGLSALLTEDDTLVDGLGKTLQTLANHQGKHGEIASNVDGETGDVSFGGTVGRVDSVCWFLIGMGEFVLHTGDEEFLRKNLPAIEKTLFLLGAWEFNGKGLLYVPVGGDWADEFIQHGYILYDQLLYLQALRSVFELYEKYNIETPEYRQELAEKIHHLFHLIQVNFWYCPEYQESKYVYHPVMYKRGLEMYSEEQFYWFSYLTPTGNGYRFDAFANLLSILLGVSQPTQTAEIFSYCSDISLLRHSQLVPAFYPVVKPNHTAEWQELLGNYSFQFKNKPFHYHNGGLWPMLTGFYAMALTEDGKAEQAKYFLDGINSGNARGQDEPWEFREFHHGKTLDPLGTKLQGWSAAAAIMAHYSIFEGKKLFRVTGPKTSFNPLPNS